MRSFWRAIALPCGVAGLSLSPTAQAQTAGTDASGDIIVTARRVEERLQDVPISITVFNQEQLSNRNVVNAQDLANYTPSLSVSTNFGADNTSFALRGFVQDTGTQPSVGVYFADVVSPRAGISSGIQSGDGAGPGSFFDLQNVQVLKGPQGTLFGRNTTGGAILLVPQKPVDKFQGYLEGGIGNYNQRRIQGVLNVPLADSFLVRLAVDHQTRDGYEHNDSGIGPKALGNLDYTAARLSIVAELTPTLENYTIASYLHSRTDGSTQAIIDCDPNSAFGALACAQIATSQAKGRGFYTVENAVANPFSKIDQWQVINTTTWQASDGLTIKNITSYAELRNNLRADYGGTVWPMGPGNPVTFSVIMAPPGYDIAAQSTFTEELQFQGRTPNGRLNWQAGGYYEYSGALGDSGGASPVFLSCQNGISDGLRCTDPIGIGYSQAFGVPINVGSVGHSLGQTNYRDVGMYAQGTYKLAERLSLTGGARYTWDSQDSVNTRLSYNFPVVPPFTASPVATCFDASTIADNCRYSASEKSHKPTWLISLEYKPDSNLLLYAKYARGYRAGGVFPNAPTNYRIYSPEKVDTYEVGSKWSFAGALKGHLDVAGFYNNFENQQLFIGFNPAPGKSAGSTSGIVNAGKSRIYGVEAEASISPFEGLTLDGGYTYLNATIRKIAQLISTDPNYILAASVFPGDPLLLSPKHKATATATYTLPLDEGVGRISVGGTVSYTSRQLSCYDFNNPVIAASYNRNLCELPSRTLLSLNFNWKSIAGSPVDLALFATNITQKKYYTYVPSFGTLGMFVGTLGEPRMYGMRLRYSFGR